jgi:alpha-1,2-mannosyltransferase
VARLTPGDRRILLLGVLYAAVVVPIGIRKGTDLEAHLELADRVLRGVPLYQGNPSLGVWWPPFAVLALTPFALLARASLALAKAAYALLGVACVGWSLVRLGAPAWRRTALALAAVAVPLQTNFEYLNINAILLALVVAAGADLASERDTRAGVWLGLATALKLFPGLLLVYCAYRRRWRTCAVGAALATGLTALALLADDRAGALGTAQRWLSFTLAGSWLVHPGNQSLVALVARAGGSHESALAVEAVLLMLTALALRHRPLEEELPAEMGLVTLLALLLSPIAWSHYFLLALPAWAAVLSPRREPLGPAMAVALLIAGIATSGVLTIWSRAFKLTLLSHSIYTWGGLLLGAVLLRERALRPLPAPQRP